MPRSCSKEREEKATGSFYCLRAAFRKWRRPFKKPEIIGRGFSSGLSGGHKQRLAACQAGLKQFQLPDLYTFRKEEVYYFPQRRQRSRMQFTIQLSGLAMGEWMHARATCQDGIDTFIPHVVSKNAPKSQNATLNVEGKRKLWLNWTQPGYIYTNSPPRPPPLFIQSNTNQILASGSSSCFIQKHISNVIIALYIYFCELKFNTSHAHLYNCTAVRNIFWVDAPNVAREVRA